MKIIDLLSNYTIVTWWYRSMVTEFLFWTIPLLRPIDVNVSHLNTLIGPILSFQNWDVAMEQRVIIFRIWFGCLYCLYPDLVVHTPEFHK